MLSFHAWPAILLLLQSFHIVESFCLEKPIHFVKGSAELINRRVAPSNFSHETQTTNAAQGDTAGTRHFPPDDNMSSVTYRLFGNFKISLSHVFYKSIHSFALVNLRPLVPGHVLVVSDRVTPLLSDLNDDEFDDLWRTVRKIQNVLKKKYECDAFNVAVQDGMGAGQSVPHVHVHILPRYCGDLERNDDIYEKLDSWAPRDDMSMKSKLEVPEDHERRDRTTEEMDEEASQYRSLMADQP